MSKRDTIIVVFRVIAIFVLFTLVTNISTILQIWFSPRYLHDLSLFSRYLLETSLVSKILFIFFVIGIPIVIAYLLWNRSSWIADKILAPFGMDELWDDEEQIITEVLLTENDPPQEILPLNEASTMTHLSRTEIESLCFTVIAVWVLSNSIPEVFKSIFGLLSSSSLGVSSGNDYMLYIPPFFKTVIGVLLLFNSNNLVAWLRRWREHRMQD